MTSTRALLLNQLEIPWSLATRHHFPALTDDIAQWAPSSHVCGLVERDGQLVGEWPDETSLPLSDTTIGWLLWHIEWWWSDAVRGVAGSPRSDPLTTSWSGSVATSITRITELHDDWVHLLRSTDHDHLCRGPWPTPQPFATIAGWVNVELMKNIAEIGQLRCLYGNRATAP